jgi:threonyl-tRNA synthetase
MKCELIEERAGEIFSEYTLGPNFIDFCRGPHLPSTKKIKAFKLLSIAGAYWKGDENRHQLQRIYGTAWYSAKELEEHLNKLEEAKKRDHRVLGKQLGLFAVDDQVGQGLILWKPKGSMIRQELQTFISEHLRRQGYHRSSRRTSANSNSTKPPAISRITPTASFRRWWTASRSRNWRAKAARARSCRTCWTKGEIEGFLLKPMNCPHHIRIYDSDPHSYRDLPIRLSEFGTVYRFEQSGELGGMTRVRGFTQDDAHIFCTEEQVPQEVAGCLELVKIIFGTLGMKDYRVRVGCATPTAPSMSATPSSGTAPKRRAKRRPNRSACRSRSNPAKPRFTGRRSTSWCRT